MATNDTKLLIKKLVDLNLIQELVENSYFYSPNFFPTEFTRALQDQCHTIYEAGKMRPAKIGKKILKKRAQKIRGDFISWVDNLSPNNSPAVKSYLSFLEELQELLKNELRLALKRNESHFAVYPKGALYKKHLDQHKGSPHRHISCIHYLNEAQNPNEGGGQIVLCNLENKTLGTYPPRSGALLIFLSALIPHEVLASSFTRMTFTSWFRDDETILIT